MNLTNRELWNLRCLFADLTQDEISLMFGFGHKTFHRYLSGKMTPTLAHARYMILVLTLPEAAKALRYIQGRSTDLGQDLPRTKPDRTRTGQNLGR